MTSTSAAPAARSRVPFLRRRWPTAVGLAAAALALAGGADARTAAVAVTVAATCYLAAAAFGRRWVAWAAILPGCAVVVLGELGGLSWWGGLGVVSAVLLALGTARGAGHGLLGAETLALLAYGGAAVAAVAVPGRLALVLAGAALGAHAVWDAVHYRRDAVVPRSLAESCMALDLPVGLAVATLGVLG